MKTEEPRGGHKDGGRAQGVGRTPTLVGPLDPPDLILSPIFPNVPKPPEASMKTLFHRRNLLYL